MRGLRRFVVLFGGLLIVCGTGCQAFQTMGDFAQRIAPGRPDPTDQEQAVWKEDVGREARGDRKREVDPDPWFPRSSKARSIERSVGVD